MHFINKNAILVMLVLKSKFFRAKKLRKEEITNNNGKIYPKTEVSICREYAIFAVKVKLLVTT